MFIPFETRRRFHLIIFLYNLSMLRRSFTYATTVSICSTDTPLSSYNLLPNWLEQENRQSEKNVEEQKIYLVYDIVINGEENCTLSLAIPLFVTWSFVYLHTFWDYLVYSSFLVIRQCYIKSIIIIIIMKNIPLWTTVRMMAISVFFFSILFLPFFFFIFYVSPFSFLQQ